MFGKWPGQTRGDVDRSCDGNDHGQLLGALTNNPAGRVLLDIPESVLRLGRWNDPWGRAFVIALDENDDGRTAVRATNSFFPPVLLNTDVVDTAAVLSWGPEPANDSKRVCTWRR